MRGKSLAIYRADIDGLRAIAVGAVVLFHAFPNFIRGGFVGVDVFFVISGFLISSHIFKDLHAGQFSFASFYAKRVIRIFPALLVVLVFTWVVSWVVLFDDEFKQLGNHLVRAAVFLSNFLLWHESGYFDNIAETKILLHLWSLAIEEQFYIVWPLVLWGVWRCGGVVWLGLLSLLAASFAWNGWLSQTDLTQDFYSPLSRFWELMCGALLAYGQHAKKTWATSSVFQSDGVSLLGLMLLLFSLIGIHSTLAFPGYWALMPVIGSVFLIASGPSAVVNRFVLSQPLMTRLGVWSYPLYLWHWPVFAMVRVVNGEQVSVGLRCAMVILCVGLAWVTYRWVEVPLRFRIKHPLKAWALLGSMGLLGCLGYVTYKSEGWPNREIMSAKYVMHEGDIGHDKFHQYFQDHFFPCEEERIAKTAGSWKGMVRCFQSKESSQFDLTLIGDSHAEHLFIGLAQALPGKNVVFYSKPALPLMSEPEFTTVFDVIQTSKNYSSVVLAANWAPKLKGYDRELFEMNLEKTVNALLVANKQVYLLSDIPQFHFDPQRCKYQRPFTGDVKCDMPYDLAQAQWSEYGAAMAAVQQKHPSVRVLDLNPLFCAEGRCSMAREKQLFYRDNNHLNIGGSQYLGLSIVDNFQQIKR